MNIFRYALCLLAFSGPAMLSQAQQQVSATNWTPTVNTPNFVWYPTQMALRFGKIDSSFPTYWASANVGNYSFAAGLNAYASAANSFAFGTYAHAEAADSFVFGTNATSSSQGGFVFGDSAYGGGYHPLVIGLESAAVEESIVLGSYSYGAEASVAVGYMTYVSAQGVAVGWGATSMGIYSSSVGPLSIANGSYALAAGSYTLAPAHGSVALGHGNKAKTKSAGDPDPGVPSPSDPILMVGNAPTTWDHSTDAHRANALTIYRDGDVHATGAIRVPQRGDIGMGSYTAKPSGVVYP